MAPARRMPLYWFEAAHAPALHTLPTPRAYAYEYMPDLLRREIDQAFTGLLSTLAAPFGDRAKQARGFAPRLDLLSDATAYTVTIELPGVNPEDIAIELKENRLTIQGEKKSGRDEAQPQSGCYRVERTYGTFRRVIDLPADAARDGITATNKDGVLSISIPRQEHREPETRTIAINA